MCASSNNCCGSWHSCALASWHHSRCYPTGERPRPDPKDAQRQRPAAQKRHRSRCSAGEAGRRPRGKGGP
eukprot:10797423-Alexandrium_andersonii.AAC.1